MTIAPAESEIIKDPYYGSAYAVLGSIAAVEDAGFFRAGAGRVAPAEVEWMSVPFEKIRRRLAARASDDERPAVVLLTTGAFNPPHDGHVQMMESARAELEARGYYVAGGYLSPSHDGYVSMKLGEQALGAVARLDLCQVITAESAWLMASGWEALGVDRAVNFTDVIVWTEAYLARHFKNAALQVVYVFGSDNVRFVRTFVARGMCVCVVRPGATDQVERYAGDPHVRANPRILFAGRSSVAASSSQIRGGQVELMAERARRRYAQRLADRAPALARRRGVVVLRDECGWEIEPWFVGRDLARLLAARAWLHAQLAMLLRDVHARAGTDVEFHRLRLDDQRAQVAALAGRRVLSIDAAIAGDVDLAVSRCFALAGAHMAPVLSHRPGSAALADQLAALPDGGCVLVDDDVCTGATLRAIRALLPAGVRVEEECILHRRGAGQIDVLDCRDFLVGSRAGGLVVALPDGTLARAPYCLPYASACERASVPLAEELGFSAAVWRHNAEFFDRIEPVRLAEADPAFRELAAHLGFDPATSMAEICRWHADRCERTRERVTLRP